MPREIEDVDCGSGEGGDRVFEIGAVIVSGASGRPVHILVNDGVRDLEIYLYRMEQSFLQLSSFEGF